MRYTKLTFVFIVALSIALAGCTSSIDLEKERGLSNDQKEQASKNEDWQTYETDEYIIKYPQGFFIDKKDDQTAFANYENALSFNKGNSPEDLLMFHVSKADKISEYHKLADQQSIRALSNGVEMEIYDFTSDYKDDELDNVTPVVYAYVPVNDQYIYLYHASVVPMQEEIYEMFKKALKTFELQTDVSQEDWQIYRNEEYGFELSYPDEWTLNIRESGFIEFFDPNNKVYFENSEAYLVGISIRDFNNIDELNRYVNNWKETKKERGGSIEELSLNNIKAIQGEDYLGLVTIIENDNNLYTVTKGVFSPEYKTIDDVYIGILNSWKFIK